MLRRLALLVLGCSAGSAAFAASYAGFHDSADCTSIRGWACDSTQPNTAISVDISDGSALLTSLSANAYRSDLASAGKGNGYHAFTLATPVSLMNGQTHAITVKYGGTQTNLGNTPRSISCAAPAATTLGLSSSANPATTGQTTVLTATLSPTAATGSITFLDGSTTLGTASLSSGVATLGQSFASASTHSLTATYAGSTAYGASTSAAARLTWSRNF